MLGKWASSISHKNIRCKRKKFRIRKFFRTLNNPTTLWDTVLFSCTVVSNFLWCCEIFPYDLIWWKKYILMKKVKVTLRSFVCLFFSLRRRFDEIFGEFHYLLLKDLDCLPAKEEASLEAKMPTISLTPFWHSSSVYRVVETHWELRSICFFIYALW